MKLMLAPKAHLVNCAGNQCEERSECMRYLRPAAWPRKDYQTGEYTVQNWASYDVERQKFGHCPHKLVPHGAMADAFARAAA